MMFAVLQNVEVSIKGSVTLAAAIGVAKCRSLKPHPCGPAVKPALSVLSLVRSVSKGASTMKTHPSLRTKK